VSSARLVLSNARLADGSTDFGSQRRTLVVEDGVITSIDLPSRRAGRCPRSRGRDGSARAHRRAHARAEQ